MPLSVTCQCGSRLEIDEKFLGKEILCPDCQRPLPTKAPAAPPALETPLHQRTSGFAILSLTASLVGAFTLVGTLAGIVFGIIALRQISRQPGKLTGAGLARGGILLGAFFTALTLAQLVFPRLAFGVDEYLRWLAYPTRLESKTGENFTSTPRFGQEIKIKRPSMQWRQYIPKEAAATNDDLIAIHIPLNAFLAHQTVAIDNIDERTAEAREKKALERFEKSELVNLIGRLGSRPFTLEGTKWEIVDNKKTVLGNDPAREQEFLIDVRLRSGMKRFLIRWTALNDVQLRVLAGGTDPWRFHLVEADLRTAFDNVR